MRCEKCGLDEVSECMCDNRYDALIKRCKDKRKKVLEDLRKERQ